MHAARCEFYRRLEEFYGAKVLTYVTGDRTGLETQVHKEALDIMVHHLDALQDYNGRILLILHTRGGDTLAGWSIVNLIRQFSNEFWVLIPFKAHSTGTLIALGADTIIMTKQATISPIDPSINGPLNPEVPGAPPTMRYPVSVEAVNGFLEFAKQGLEGREYDPRQAMDYLCRSVHPLVLGDVHRSRSQIRMLASKLLERQIDEPEVDGILDFLCSDSGSHDYTISRREARDRLNLNVDKPTAEIYDSIRAVYDNVVTDLELNIPYDPNNFIGGAGPVSYTFRRAIIESVAGGCHYFLSKGTLQKKQVPLGAGPHGPVFGEGIDDKRTFEGWEHAPTGNIPNQ